MTPAFKFLGVVFIAVLLAVAFVNGAHAAVPDDETQAACVGFVVAEVPAIHELLDEGTNPAIVKYLVLTRRDLGDYGRWVLVSFIELWALADSLDRPLTPQAAALVAVQLCHMEPQPVQGPYIEPFSQPKYPEL